jgi:hypothetical protein
MDFHIVYSVLGGVFVVFKNCEFNMMTTNGGVRKCAWVGGVGEGVIDLCECRCERKGVRLGVRLGVGVGVWVSGLRCGANAMRTGVNGEGEEVIPS